MTTMLFSVEMTQIGSWTIIHLPKAASAKLPSRGMCIAEAVLNGVSFQAALEPDGERGHWFNVDQTLLEAAGAEPGATVMLTLEPAQEWQEPQLPEDMRQALAANPGANEPWLDITTKARWDWIRWMRATKNPVTRKTRIETACSMLGSDKRRPCCFNRSQCTEPSVSKNGVLLRPTTTKG